MAIKNYHYAKWWKNECDYDIGRPAEPTTEAVPCLDAKREAEWKAKNEHPCITYYSEEVKHNGTNK